MKKLKKKFLNKIKKIKKLDEKKKFSLLSFYHKYIYIIFFC